MDPKSKKLQAELQELILSGIAEKIDTAFRLAKENNFDIKEFLSPYLAVIPKINRQELAAFFSVKELTVIYRHPDLAGLRSPYLYSWDEFRHFTKHIGLYLQLESISVDGSGFSVKLPGAVAKFSNLRNLSAAIVDGNLPKGLEKLPHLESVTIGHIHLKSYEGLVQLIALSDILKVREITLSAGISELPQNIGALAGTGLEILHLHGNCLTSLPDSFAELKNLEELDLSRNAFTDIPPQIAALENLTSLTISYNQLTALPDFLADLKELTSLSIEENRISAVPDFLKNEKIYLWT